MHRINAGSGTLVSGVGIAFLQDVQGERQTYVHRIYKGGSAEQDGKVQVGDVLEKVEHLPVHGKPLSEIKHIMLGEVGTYVNLLFRRTNPDGSIVQYDVSLMRGQTESFLLKEKQRLQSLLDSDRKQMQHAEIEIEALRGALYRADMHKNQDFDEKQHLTMAIKEKSLKIEELQALIISIQQEIDNMSKDLVDSSDIKEEMQNLTKMLADAESHIIAAKESLEKDQLLTQELQDKWKNEKLARTNCETRIAKLQMEFPAREEQERSYRMHQEQLKAKLEQSRSKAMEEMNDALRRKEEELRKLREAEKAEAESEEQFAQVSANNQEIQGRVRETEKSLRAAENARLDAVNRNEVLMAELSRIRNQLQMREQVINDLQAKIEEDFDKWQISLTSAKHGRKQDEMSFLDAERGLNEEIRKVQQNRADLEDSMMEILRNLEKRQIELERAHQDLERLLAEQRNNTTSLRGDVQNLTQQQQETEAEIQRCRNEIQRIEAACKVCIQETGLCEQRRSHLSSEYDMLMRKERLRIEYMEQTQALNKQAMEEIEKALLEVEESKKTILKDKEKIQAEIDKCAGAIRKFLEADRDRKQQMNDFQNKRKIILDGMNSMLSNQEDLKKIIEEVRQPVSRVLSYYNRSYASVAPASAYKSFEISDKSFEKSSYSTSYYSSEGSFPKYSNRSYIYSSVPSYNYQVAGSTHHFTSNDALA